MFKKRYMKRILLLSMVFIVVMLIPSFQITGMSVQNVEEPVISVLVFGLIAVVLTLSVFRILKS
jgi:hypothetical protein